MIVTEQKSNRMTHSYTHADQKQNVHMKNEFHIQWATNNNFVGGKMTSKNVDLNCIRFEYSENMLMV